MSGFFIQLQQQPDAAGAVANTSVTTGSTCPSKPRILRPPRKQVIVPRVELETSETHNIPISPVILPKIVKNVLVLKRPGRKTQIMYTTTTPPGNGNISTGLSNVRNTSSIIPVMEQATLTPNNPDSLTQNSLTVKSSNIRNSSVTPAAAPVTQKEPLGFTQDSLTSTLKRSNFTNVSFNVNSGIVHEDKDEVNNLEAIASQNSFRLRLLNSQVPNQNFNESYLLTTCGLKLNREEIIEDTSVNTKSESGAVEKFGSSLITSPKSQPDQVNICPICGKPLFSRFKSSSSGLLSSHLRTHMNLEEQRREFSCQKCGKIFPKPYLLQSHIQTHLPHESRQVFSCDDPGCTYSALNKYTLRKHQNTMHGDPGNFKFQCPRCSKGFHRPSDLKDHDGFCCDPLERPYRCIHCEKRFQEKKHLIKHYHGVHKMDKIEARSLVYKFKNSNPRTGPGLRLAEGEIRAFLNQHVKTQLPRRVFICDEPNCNFSVSALSRRALRNHKQRMHSTSINAKLKCPRCSKVFHRLSDRNEHDAFCCDPLDRPYPCVYCGRRFKVKRNLFKHYYKVHKMDRKEAWARVYTSNDTNPQKRCKVPEVVANGQNPPIATAIRTRTSLKSKLRQRPVIGDASDLNVLKTDLTDTDDIKKERNDPLSGNDSEITLEYPCYLCADILNTSDNLHEHIERQHFHNAPERQIYSCIGPVVPVEPFIKQEFNVALKNDPDESFNI